MGPRSVDRGNGFVTWIADGYAARLQWGRDLLIAETCGLPDSCPRQPPLQWGRDLLIAETLDAPLDLLYGQRASMGPRSVDRGNVTREAEYLKSLGMLQWGRDLLIAETATPCKRASCCTPLQWGRDLLIAETPGGSGGARSVDPLQWGRDLLIAETHRLKL